MEVVALIRGNIHSGKTMITKILEKNYINCIMHNQYNFVNNFDNMEMIFWNLKRIVKQNKSNIELQEFFSNILNNIFLRGEFKHNRTKTIEHKIDIIEKFNLHKHISLINIFIFRDPRISWLLNNDYKKEQIYDFIIIYKNKFKRYINNQQQYTLIIFEKFTIEYKKIMKNILKIHNKKTIIELPSPRYNYFLNYIDLEIMKQCIITKKGLTDDFKILEDKLKDEMNFLGYNSPIEIKNIIKESYEVFN
jgi:hypothetical protein